MTLKAVRPRDVEVEVRRAVAEEEEEEERRPDLSPF